MQPKCEEHVSHISSGILEIIVALSKYSLHGANLTLLLMTLTWDEREVNRAAHEKNDDPFSIFSSLI